LGNLGFPLGPGAKGVGGLTVVPCPRFSPSIQPKPSLSYASNFHKFSSYPLVGSFSLSLVEVLSYGGSLSMSKGCTSLTVNTTLCMAKGLRNRLSYVYDISRGFKFLFLDWREKEINSLFLGGICLAAGIITFKIFIKLFSKVSMRSFLDPISLIASP
jgi:hypothetical protein